MVEGETLLSPIPRHSKFEFPWSTHILGDEPSVVPEDIHGKNQVYENEDFDSNAMSWKVFSKDEDEGTVTLHLLRESWCLFKDVRLKHWVEVVMGMPSMAIALLESYHNRLGYSLFSFLGHFPQETAKYRSVAMVRYRCLTNPTELTHQRPFVPLTDSCTQRL